MGTGQPGVVAGVAFHRDMTWRSAEHGVLDPIAKPATSPLPPAHSEHYRALLSKG